MSDPTPNEQTPKTPEEAEKLAKKKAKAEAKAAKVAKAKEKKAAAANPAANAPVRCTLNTDNYKLLIISTLFSTEKRNPIEERIC